MSGETDEPVNLFGQTEKELRKIRTKTTLELINKYGRMVHCGDCFWFCECEPCSPSGFEGICCATKWDFEINKNTSPCFRFELESEANKE